ncbi:MAG: hypothetical protein ACLFTT_06725 [Candidatus Hydrogenedentota bacterium]
MQPMRSPIVFCLLLLAAAPFMCLVNDASGAEVLKQDVFAIHHHPDDRRAAEQSARVLVRAVREFGGHLPPGDEPINVVIAHTAQEFARYARSFGGNRVSGLARPSQGLIVVKAPHLRFAQSDFAGTLRHELVHVLLARNTTAGNMPKWLNEGLCMSLANEHYWNSIFKIARMYVQGRIIDYKDLELSFTAPGTEQAFGDAYAQGLSMTRYLRDQLGDARFWLFIQDMASMSFADALDKHTGMTVLEFWHAYRGSLWKVAIIGTIGSGSVFSLGAVLLVLAVIRKWIFTNRRILRRWEEEDRDDVILSWDDVAEGPYEWERDQEEENGRW